MSDMEITGESVIWDIVESMPEARELFAGHGCEMDAECTPQAMENSLDIAEGLYQLEDIDGLILELQALAEILAQQA